MDSEAGNESEIETGSQEGGEQGEGQQEGAETGGQEATATTAGEPGGQEKPDRRPYQRNKDRAKIRESAERERVALEENRRLRETLDAMRRTQEQTNSILERSIPKEKDPNQTKMEDLQARYRAAAKRMGTDASAYEEWESLGREINRLDTQMTVDAALARQRQTDEHNRPPEVPPEVNRLADEFTWLRGSSREADSYRKATEAEIVRLATKHSRNMEDPKVRFATMREAAATVAEQWGLDPGYRQESGGRERLSGTTGKLSGGGSGGTVDIQPTEDLMAIAAARFPNDSPEVQWKKLKERVINKMGAQK